MIDGWTDSEATALLAAMADVANKRDGGAARAAIGMVDGAAQHVFDLDVRFDDLPSSTPAELAKVMVTPEKRDMAVQFLVLMAYAAAPVQEPQVADVESYARGLGTESRSLNYLHKVREGHIRRLFLDYTRHALKNEGQSMRSLPKLAKSLHEYVGSPRMAEKYRALDDYELGTLGRTFFTFYRSRGFSLPGEKHSLGEFFVGHDCAHILSGFNTDATGEINVAGFEAGMRANDYGYPLLMEVLLDFQLGIDFGVSLIGYQVTADQMDTEMFMIGINRGLRSNTDFMGPDWDFWQHAGRPVVDLREQYDIRGVSGINMAPPAVPATAVRHQRGPEV